MSRHARCYPEQLTENLQKNCIGVFPRALHLKTTILGEIQTMISDRATGVLRDIQTLFGVGAVGSLTDGQLLDRFLTRHGEAAEAAFEALIERHGPMVLRVCRAQLTDLHDIEDCFQATFLVFVRKAASIRKQGSLSSWLYGVAHKVAARARASASRRRLCEAGSSPILLRASNPIRKRKLCSTRKSAGFPPSTAPIVLCYLEGLSHDRAAEHLGWPVGTVRGRLARARDLLRNRLTRRGVAVSVGLGVMESVGPNASAARVVPPALVRTTVEAALRFAAGPTAAVLAAETLKAMSFRVVRIAASSVALGAAVLALVLLPAFGIFPSSGRKPAQQEANKIATKDVAAAQNPAEPTNHAVELLVLDGTTGKPVSDAEVEIIEAEDGFAEKDPVLTRGVTDQRGHCVLEVSGELPSSAAAVARKAGLVSAIYPLNPRTAREAHTFTLEPPATTTGGLVKDDSGKPIAGATVRNPGITREPHRQRFRPLRSQGDNRRSGALDVQ